MFGFYVDVKFSILLLAFLIDCICGEPPLLTFPTERKSSNGLLETTLSVRTMRWKVDNVIEFNTRAYEGSIPGPTLRVKPGDLLRVHLQNFLEPNSPRDKYKKINEMRNPNTTNLHVHGLHVSALSNSDNMMIQINPGENFTYEFYIPENHGAGTFWYHAHHHGSAALQMGGGMLGALIIDHADTESLDPALVAMEEIVLVVFQALFKNVQYGDVFHNHDNMYMISDMTESELPLDLSILPDGRADTDPDTGDGGWTLVNGRLRPSYPILTSKYYRVRLINSGPSEILELTLDGCEMNLLAMDGIYLKESWKSISVVVVPPGGRTDFAIRCSKVGTYYLVSDASHSRDAFLGERGQRHNGTLMSFSVVEDSTSKNPSFPSQLPSWPSYLADLSKVEAPTDPDNYYAINFEHETGAMMDFYINNARFNPELYNHSLFLGEMEQWAISSTENRSNHAYHHHTHSFQIMTVHGSEKPSEDSMIGTTLRPGMWRDTIPVLGDPQRRYTVLIRFKPVDFEGHVMIHCHIPSHLDMGMGQMGYTYPSKDSANWFVNSSSWVVYSVVVVSILFFGGVVTFIWKRRKRLQNALAMARVGKNSGYLSQNGDETNGHTTLSMVELEPNHNGTSNGLTGRTSTTTNKNSNKD